jgi:5-methylcytosine-specific restriction endonuclease McrBC GTP-binding regulatory subunit McrB
MKNNISSNREEFKNWMNKNHPKNTVEQYCVYLGYPEHSTIIPNEYRKTFFTYEDIESYKKVVDVFGNYLLNETVFDVDENKNKKKISNFKSALEKYKDFLMEKNKVSNMIKYDKEPSGLVSKFTTLLKSTRNLILTGAPGTGKTYLAKEIAAAMGCTENEIGFVQFHPSYDYTDFVEGLRPVSKDNCDNIGFERKDGVFKEFCKKALTIGHFVPTISPMQVGRPEIETLQSNNSSSFDEVYDRLKNDIKNSTALLYSDFRSKKTQLKARVEDGEIKFWKTNDYQRANPDYLKKLYDYYYNKGIFDIREEGLDDFKKIIGHTLDYSCYRGIVQALLDITRQNIDIKEIDISENQDDNPVSFTQERECVVDLVSKPFVFIIDEINRGEISKIFGELFFSIDPGYRGEKGRVKTQYQNLVEEGDMFSDGFFVPENVYIIGTMNDIDRSVESMDFAFRRRFAFAEVKAEDNVKMLDELEVLDLKDDAINRMNRLNSAISKIEGLSSAYHIGASYFLKLKEYGDDCWEALWNYHLEGLLREYLRGMPNMDELMEKLENAYWRDESDSDN